MQYGLIGEKLGHSYSKEIHAQIAPYDYELKELAPSELEDFFKRRDFKALNVTIPYKQAVIPLLDFVSDEAKSIGAVNTVVNKDGRLYGYNTDFAGMKAMLMYYGIDVKGKKALVLGTGGTSKTANAVLDSLGASEILTVSRSSGNGKISYTEAVEKHNDAQIIINTTPVGMYPNTDITPIDISAFSNLTGVADAVYNPLRTVLVSEAKKRGIPACAGLYMLAGQAFYASALFQDKKLDYALIEKAFKAVEKKKENIVLIGMPSCGKSTVGQRLAKALGREFYDSDKEILPYLGMPINDYFESKGEALFREFERNVIYELSKKSGCVIATGGGVPLFSENMERLRRNGIVVFLDRSPEKLLATPDRPLSSDPEKLMKRYRERYSIYCKEADIHIPADKGINEVLDEVIKNLDR